MELVKFVICASRKDTDIDMCDKWPEFASPQLEKKSTFAK
jgi:hypothetical protein